MMGHNGTRPENITELLLGICGEPRSVFPGATRNMETRKGEASRELAKQKLELEGF